MGLGHVRTCDPRARLVRLGGRKPCAGQILLLDQAQCDTFGIKRVRHPDWARFGYLDRASAVKLRKVVPSARLAIVPRQLTLR